MGVLVEPKPGSYVTEWEAVQVDVSDFAGIKRIMRGSPWLVQIVLDDDGAHVLCTQIQNGQIEKWVSRSGDWIVRSPHGKYWFMGDIEFRDQFLRLS
jgi:hypothetical protein